MKILLHPKIDWAGWQAIKRSSLFQSLSSGEQICLTDRLPLQLWQKEQATARNAAGRAGCSLQKAAIDARVDIGRS
ncbi:MAG: hypothetical protein RQ754_12110 [Desulfuromonadales bacterium]|nr:hypothetical protein [Desulfuromonadales bacterium]